MLSKCCCISAASCCVVLLSLINAVSCRGLNTYKHRDIQSICSTLAEWGISVLLWTRCMALYVLLRQVILHAYKCNPQQDNVMCCCP